MSGRLVLDGRLILILAVIVLLLLTLERASSPRRMPYTDTCVYTITYEYACAHTYTREGAWFSTDVSMGMDEGTSTLSPAPPVLWNSTYHVEPATRGNVEMGEGGLSTFAIRTTTYT